MTTLLLALFLFSTAHAEEKPLPDACKTACVSEFGTVLGKTADGVEAHSNCQPHCVYLSPVEQDGTFLGIKWQCVEFARRWLYTNYGMTFPSIDYAYEFWGKVDHLVDVKKKQDVPLENHLNGDSSRPKHGDLFLYGQDLAGTGHIAVVLKVDSKNVYVGEENLQNKAWPASYSRAIAYVRKNGGYWVLDPYFVGWKRAKTLPR